MKRDLHLAATASALSPGEPPREILLIPAGRIPTRPNDGRADWHNPDADAIVSATRELRLDLPVDYEHQTQRAAENGQPAPAAGWIKSVFSRDGAVWGEVEWTSRAAEHIRAREYRYTSATFFYDWATRVVQRVTGAALTNEPALFMQAIASANSITSDEDDDMKLDELRKILGLPAEATADQVQAAVKAAAAAATGLAAIGKALDLEGADGDAVIAALKAQGAAIGGIREAAGVQPEASLAEIAEAVKTAKAAAGANSGGNGEFVPRAEFDRVKEDLAKLQSGGAQAAATAAVDKAIEDGKLTPASREWGLAYAAADPEGFAKFTDSAPTILKSGQVVQGDPDKGGDALSDDELAVCRAFGLDREKYLESRKAIAESN